MSVCILFALRRESAPFCRAFKQWRAFPDSPCGARIYGDLPGVVVAETGVGQANVGRVLDWLLAKPMLDGAAYEPSVVVFAGFAGAVSEALHVGDVVAAEEVMDELGNRWCPTWPAERKGWLLTVGQMTATPDEKRRLASKHGVDAVEMESAVFAARCAAAGIPFGCIRAISDEVQTTLSPALLSMLSGGRVSLGRVCRALVRRPMLLPELIRLGRDTRRAAVQLRDKLCVLLDQPAHQRA